MGANFTAMAAHGIAMHEHLTISFRPTRKFHE